MENLKLFGLFSSFSQKDWDSFSLYVKSHDGSSSRKFFPLVTEFRKYFSHKESFDDAGVLSLLEKAYGKGSYKYQTIKNRQSELLKIAEKFLRYQSLEKDFLAEEFYLLDNLFDRGLRKNYSGLFEMIREKLDGRKFDESAFLKLDRYYLLKASHFQSSNKPEDGFNSYFEHSNVLIAYWLCRIYREGFEYIIQMSYNITYDFNPVFEFLKHFDDEPFFLKLEKQKKDIYLIPLIRFYMFKSIQNLNEGRYIAKSKKLYFDNEKKFTDEFKTEIYRMLMSYYLLKINSGEKKYYTHLFYLHQKKLNQGLISDIKRCTYPANVFREYVIVALKLNRFEWAQKFVKKYSHLLPENIREDEMSLANIRILFSKKDFVKTLALIEKTKSDKYLHYLDTSRFKLMTYFELSRFEESYPEIDRIRHYFRNNKKLPGFDVNSFSVFLEKLSGLIKIKLDPDKKNKDYFISELQNSKVFITSKEWFLEKAKEL
ncbi:MAG: hypothetical protein PHN88_04275 [Ignavibacteria bacterium]|nr:hypothetical protein [Ignavibacteria bacterium]